MSLKNTFNVNCNTIILWLTMLLTFVSGQLFSQLSPNSTQYMLDYYSDNPAYAGLNRSLSINLKSRTQWQNLNNNPRQINLNGHLPVYLINGGSGFALKSIKMGAIKYTAGSLSYNYITPINQGVMSLGMRMGVSQIEYDGSQLITPDGIYDNAIDHRDPILSSDIANNLAANYTLGFFIGHNKFDLGVSVNNLGIGDSNVNEANVADNSKLSIFYAMPIRGENLTFTPNLLAKTNFKQMQLDIGILIKNGSVFGGTSVRGYNSTSIDAINIIGGIKINEHYTLSYSYDIGINDLRDVNQGSHEFILNYNLNKLIGIGLPPEIIYNPRNL